MDELEQIRQRRMAELQAQAQAQAQSQAQAGAPDMQTQMRMQQEYEAQKKKILMQILTPEARSRLANIKLAKPENADAIELQLIQLAQAGRIQKKITEEQLKELLRRINGPKKEMKISRK